MTKEHLVFEYLMRSPKWLWIGVTFALIGVAVLMPFPVGRAPAVSTVKGENPPDLLGYSNHVQSAAFADRGKTIVTVAWRGDKKTNRVGTAPIEIRHWDSVAGVLKSSFDIAYPPATRAILTRDGGRVALLDPKRVTICSSTSGKTLLQLESEGNGAEFSPSGKLLAVFGSKIIEVFDTNSGHRLRTISHGDVPSAACFYHDDYLLSGSSRDVTICGPGCEEIPWGDAQWSSIERDEDPVELFDPHTPAFAGGVASVDVSPDGSWAAIAQGTGVRFFDLTMGAVSRDFIPEKYDTIPFFENTVRLGIYRVALSPDARLLAVACFQPPAYNVATHQIQLFETASGKNLATLAEHRDPIHTLRFSGDGGSVLAAGKQVKLWRLDDTLANRLELRRRHRIQGHTYFLQSLAFSPDGRTLVSGAREGCVKFWDVTTGQLRRTLDCRQRIGPLYEVTQVTFLPDGDHLIVGGGKQLEYGDAWIYDWRQDKLRQRLHGHEKPIVSIDLSADASRLVTASSDRKTILWDLKTGSQVQSVDNSNPIAVDIKVAISPDGELLFNSAKLWELPTGRLVSELSGDYGPYSCDFSPDGRRFATGNTDGTISTWDAATGKRLADVHWHHCNVDEVLFSPDGSLLVASSAREVAIFDSNLTWQHGRVSRSILTTVPGLNDRVWGLTFTRDGRLLATGDQSGLIQIWEVRATRTTLRSARRVARADAVLVWHRPKFD